jgi:hypothetical protein
MGAAWARHAMCESAFSVTRDVRIEIDSVGTGNTEIKCIPVTFVSQILKNLINHPSYLVHLSHQYYGNIR